MAIYGQSVMEAGSREGREDQVTYMMVSTGIISSETSSSISTRWSGESVFTTMISAMNSTVSSSGSGRGADGREGFRGARELVLLRRDDEPGARFFLFGAEVVRDDEVEAGESNTDDDECGAWGSEPLLLLRAGLFPMPLFCPDRALREFAPIMSSGLDFG